jgi:hypothetical protein
MAGKLLVDLFVAALAFPARMKVLRFLIEPYPCCGGEGRI